MTATFRHSTYMLFANEPPRPVSTVVVNTFITGLIIINVGAVILQSVSALNERYFVWFRLVELISALMFTIEWILRVWSCVERHELRDLSKFRARLRYVVSPLPIIDFIAIVPLYLAVFDVVSAQSLIALRLLRLLQLVRFFTPLVVLWRVVHNEAPAMLGAIFIVVVLIIIAATGMYLVERDVQPQAFGSIPAAMWWASVTLTTVGYGDVTPITVVGRMIGVVIMILGIGLVALPAGMLASRFSEELHLRREEYRRRVDMALQDGVLEDQEMVGLKAAQREYMLSDDTANQILSEESKRMREVCATCGKTVLSEPRR